MIKLNERGVMAGFYRNFYGTAVLPNNLCNFFWTMIFAIISTPFAWPAVVINILFFRFTWDEEYKYYRYPDYGRAPTVLGAFASLLFPFLGALASKLMYGHDYVYVSIIGLYINGIIFTVAVIGSIFIVVKLMIKITYWVMKKWPDEKNVDAQSREEFLKWDKKVKAKVARRERWERSFIYLCGQYIIAAKEKYCPRIEWKK